MVNRLRCDIYSFVRFPYFEIYIFEFLFGVAVYVVGVAEIVKQLLLCFGGKYVQRSHEKFNSKMICNYIRTANTSIFSIVEYR